jgi:hypothetical protein
VRPRGADALVYVRADGSVWVNAVRGSRFAGDDLTFVFFEACPQYASLDGEVE